MKIYSLICIAMLASIIVTNLACRNSLGKQSVGKESDTFLFGRGSKVSNDNFTGTVWLNYLVETDSIHNVNIGSVRFEPGARTNWHYHKGGQILLVTEGNGLYQEKGKPIKQIKKGDLVKCPPNVEHWHGATSTASMTHIALGTNTNQGGAVWLKPVTDQEYQAILFIQSQQKQPI